MQSDTPAWLVLADGTQWEGISIGALGEGVGELVFNTAMTGYQEILTDPSYARQLILLTTAHVGNTGWNLEDMESSRIWASGLIIRECSLTHDHYRAQQSLPSWLKQHDVVAIAGIDTRALTTRLREKGSIAACITTDRSRLDHALQLAQNFGDLAGVDLTPVVSRKTIERWYEGRGAWALHSPHPTRFHVVVYDFGVKHTILKILHDLGCHLTLVPADTPAETVMALHPDGVFLSNGPGDPSACHAAMKATHYFLDHDVPLFGICLGFQLLALACGAQSLKMKVGHHGANHPIIELQGQQRIFITSQNHGFAIDEASLPETLMASHRSLFDQSLQGIIHRQKPAFGVQGHPEASPGPHDSAVVFQQFIQCMHEAKYSSNTGVGVP